MAELTIKYPIKSKFYNFTSVEMNLWGILRKFLLSTFILRTRVNDLYYFRQPQLHPRKKMTCVSIIPGASSNQENLKGASAAGRCRARPLKIEAHQPSVELAVVSYGTLCGKSSSKFLQLKGNRCTQTFLNSKASFNFKCQDTKGPPSFVEPQQSRIQLSKLDSLSNELKKVKSQYMSKHYQKLEPDIEVSSKMGEKIKDPIGGQKIEEKFHPKFEFYESNQSYRFYRPSQRNYHCERNYHYEPDYHCKRKRLQESDLYDESNYHCKPHRHYNQEQYNESNHQCKRKHRYELVEPNDESSHYFERNHYQRRHQPKTEQQYRTRNSMWYEFSKGNIRRVIAYLFQQLFGNNNRSSYYNARDDFSSISASRNTLEKNNESLRIAYLNNMLQAKNLHLENAEYRKTLHKPGMKQLSSPLPSF